MRKTIWMISGLHNKNWLDNIISNYNRQTYKNKRLIIIENGNGIGAAKSIKIDGVVVLQSDKGPAQPLNKALQWLRINAKKNDWFCKCDSDDYYGPEYLNSILPAIKSKADLAGRESLYIKTTENRLWYIKGNSLGYLFHGPTLAGNISKALDFPIVNDWGEDEQWCIAMNKQKRKAYVIEPENFCYQRHEGYNHTWPCTDYEIRTSWDAEFIDIGEFDADIINGIKPRPPGTSLGVAEFTAENSMALRVLQDRLKSMGINSIMDIAKNMSIF